MTSTTDTAEHPEVSELSDLAEGLLSPSRTADVRRHLDGCALCADVQASLAEIRGLLGTLPGPPQMPADVAGRIDAALAAEALLDASLPDTGVPPVRADAAALTPEPDTAAAERETDARVSRETSPTPPTTDRPSGHPRATTGPGRPSQRRRRRITTAALGTLVTVAAIGLGTLLIQSVGDSGSDSGTTTASDQADSTFSKKKLGDQVQSLLTQSTPEFDSPEPRGSLGPDNEDGGVRTPATETATTLLGKGPPVPECVKRGINSETVPLAAEKGTYEGTAAYLVVLPHATDTSRVSAYVIDATCVNGPSSAKGEVLFTHTYPRR
ncbi:zf-HC2 domain-containing protein [Streptomyces sp. T-3]|nr:zf-HC2 domain-containing protein [Streptomyces sp. T-3]